MTAESNATARENQPENEPENEPVTVVVTRRARPGREADVDAWLRGIIAATAPFPGYQGSTVLRPRGAGQPEHVLVFRFDSAENLRRWQESEERADWLRRAEPFTERYEVKTMEGLEPFFDLPGTVAPPMWKMLLLTWIGLYPLILLVGWATNHLFVGVPFEITAAPQSMATVLFMGFPVMPWLTRITSKWLYPSQRH